MSQLYIIKQNSNCEKISLKRYLFKKYNTITFFSPNESIAVQLLRSMRPTEPLTPLRKSNVKQIQSNSKISPKSTSKILIDSHIPRKRTKTTELSAEKPNEGDVTNISEAKTHKHQRNPRKALHMAHPPPWHTATLICLGPRTISRHRNGGIVRTTNTAYNMMLIQ